jgi:hypothetical protein
MRKSVLMGLQRPLRSWGLMTVLMAELVLVLVTVVSGAAAGLKPRTIPQGVPQGVTVAAAGIQLIMVEQRGCQYCLKWDRDVGRVYPRTSEGRFAPLRRVGRNAAALKNFAPVIYTPTFIVTRNGAETGRISGYPGEPYFWEELGVLLRDIGYVPNDAGRG